MEPRPQLLSNALLSYIADLFDRTVGLPRDTLLQAFAGDDWSFAIRAHAIMEGLISHLLTVSLDIRLAKVFRKMSLNSSSSGKLAFATSLELLSKDTKAFIALLTSVRNSFAHDPKYLSYTFQQYFDELSHSDQSRFLNQLVECAAPDKKAKWLELAHTDLSDVMRKATYLQLLELFTAAYKEQLSTLRVTIPEDPQLPPQEVPPST